MMRPLSGPKSDPAKAVSSALAKGCIGAVIFMASVGTLAAGFAVVASFKWLAIPLAIAPLAAVGYWFVRKWLPKYILGEVYCEITEPHVRAGDRLRGELVLTPRRSVAINGITLKIEAREQVISGSGSNQTTHRHLFFERTLDLVETTTLKAGETVGHAIDFQVPDDAPYSLDLPANRLIWNVNLRIDIPKWPDWTKSIDFFVIPSGDVAASETTAPAADAVQLSESQPVESLGGGVTFDETINLLWLVRGDRQQRGQLVEAVTGMTFPVTAIIERRLLYGGDNDSNVFPDGHSVWARFPDPELPLVLFVPHDMGDEFEQMGSQKWTGRATVVGWDNDHGRLQLSLES